MQPLSEYDAENVISLLTEVGDGGPLALHHIKALPDRTTCGIPVLEADIRLVGWLPACRVCFAKYYEEM